MKRVSDLDKKHIINLPVVPTAEGDLNQEGAVPSVSLLLTEDETRVAGFQARNFLPHDDCDALVEWIDGHEGDLGCEVGTGRRRILGFEEKPQPFAAALRDRFQKCDRLMDRIKQHWKGMVPPGFVAKGSSWTFGEAADFNPCLRLVHTGGADPTAAAPPAQRRRTRSDSGGDAAGAAGCSTSLGAHRDIPYTASRHTRSCATVLLYLNTVEGAFFSLVRPRGEERPGAAAAALRFVEEVRVPVRRGTLLVFDQRQWHLDSAIGAGQDKYFIRTDLLMHSALPSVSLGPAPTAAEALCLHLFRQAQLLDLRGERRRADEFYSRATSLRCVPSDPRSLDLASVDDAALAWYRRWLQPLTPAAGAAANEEKEAEEEEEEEEEEEVEVAPPTRSHARGGVAAATGGAGAEEAVAALRFRRRAGGAYLFEHGLGQVADWTPEAERCVRVAAFFAAAMAVTEDRAAALCLAWSRRMAAGDCGSGDDLPFETTPESPPAPGDVLHEEIEAEDGSIESDFRRWEEVPARLWDNERVREASAPAGEQVQRAGPLLYLHREEYIGSCVCGLDGGETEVTKGHLVSRGWCPGLDVAAIPTGTGGGQVGGTVHVEGFGDSFNHASCQCEGWQLRWQVVGSRRGLGSVHWSGPFQFEADGVLRVVIHPVIVM